MGGGAFCPCFLFLQVLSDGRLSLIYVLLLDLCSTHFLLAFIIHVIVLRHVIVIYAIYTSWDYVLVNCMSNYNLYFLAHKYVTELV